MVFSIQPSRASSQQLKCSFFLFPLHFVHGPILSPYYNSSQVLRTITKPFISVSPNSVFFSAVSPVPTQCQKHDIYSLNICSMSEWTSNMVWSLQPYQPKKTKQQPEADILVFFILFLSRELWVMSVWQILVLCCRFFNHWLLQCSLVDGISPGSRVKEHATRFQIETKIHTGIS